MTDRFVGGERPRPRQFGERRRSHSFQASPPADPPFPPSSPPPPPPPPGRPASPGSSRGPRAFRDAPAAGNVPSLPRERPPLNETPEAKPRKHRRINSLSVRIVALNLVGLIIFAVGLLASNQYRQTTVDERILALRTSTSFFAGALQQSAIRERKNWKTGEPFVALDYNAVVALMRSLILPTGLRAVVYDIDGKEIYDSINLGEKDLVSTRPLTPENKPGVLTRMIDGLMLSLLGPDLTPAADNPNLPYTEVKAALDGVEDPRALQAVRLDDDGNVVLSVAAPVFQIKGLVGAVRVSTRGGDFEAVLRAERGAIFQIFGIALLANVLLAFFYARTVVGPIKRLADAADRVRMGRQKPGKDSRAEIPGFHKRSDEIGDLAASLNDMTRALNTRLDAIESFAADVSHEIKTPLTSIRSAIETLDIAKTEEARLRLIDVIKHDVDRLDRLITDISNASRLDAELSREEATEVNIPTLLENIVAIYQDSGTLNGVSLMLDVRTGARDPKALTVLGIESRLGQVVQNLIENALSFSPRGGTVRIRTGFERPGILPFISIRIEDEGPGIPEDSLEKIFQRFYTQRPDEKDFGKNSGLGLSISKQIIEAHNGRIWAENMRDGQGNVTGARFTVLIPAREAAR